MKYYQKSKCFIFLELKGTELESAKQRAVIPRYLVRNLFMSSEMELAKATDIVPCKCACHGRFATKAVTVKSGSSDATSSNKEIAQPVVADQQATDAIADREMLSRCKCRHYASEQQSNTDSENELEPNCCANAQFEIGTSPSPNHWHRNIESELMTTFSNLNQISVNEVLEYHEANCRSDDPSSM